eukprot:378928-Hanusia_phi.AAC.1
MAQGQGRTGPVDGSAERHSDVMDRGDLQLCEVLCRASGCRERLSRGRGSSDRIELARRLIVEEWISSDMAQSSTRKRMEPTHTQLVILFDET